MRGPAYAEELLATCWTADALGPAVAAGNVLIALEGGSVVGMAEHGRYDGEPVLWKLYVAPRRRSAGIGPMLLRGVVADLPSGTVRLLTEHIAENERAAAFYRREGFAVLHEGPDIIWRARPVA